MRSTLAGLVLSGVLISGMVGAQSQTPLKGQTEQAGRLSADLGASIFEIGATRQGIPTYLAHGYAAAETKPPDTTDPSKAPGATVDGEFAFRIGNLCVTSAAAQIVPIGLVNVAGIDTSEQVFITGVKVEPEETPKDSCTFVLHVTYGAKLPKSAKLTQIAYTVLLTGSTRTPDSKPVVLPLMPL